MNAAVVTMSFRGDFVSFEVFADGTARCVVDGVVRKIADFAQWFIDAVQRGWKMISQYNLPEAVKLETVAHDHRGVSRREEFRRQWFEFEDENLDNWGV